MSGNGSISPVTRTHPAAQPSGDKLPAAQLFPPAIRPNAMNRRWWWRLLSIQRFHPPTSIGVNIERAYTSRPTDPTQPTQPLRPVGLPWCGGRSAWSGV